MEHMPDSLLNEATASRGRAHGRRNAQCHGLAGAGRAGDEGKAAREQNDSVRGVAWRASTARRCRRVPLEPIQGKVLFTLDASPSSSRRSSWGTVELEAPDQGQVAKLLVREARKP